MKVFLKIICVTVSESIIIKMVTPTMENGLMIVESVEDVCICVMDLNSTACLSKIKLMGMLSMRIGLETCSKVKTRKQKRRVRLTNSPNSNSRRKTLPLSSLNLRISFFLVVSSMASCTSKLQIKFISCSLGVINFKNGDKFRGSFKDGRPCGFGTMKYV